MGGRKTFTPAPIKVGDKFGKWTVVSLPYGVARTYPCDCKCICGHIHTKIIRSIVDGRSTSCGCSRGRPIHGKNGTRIYRAWQNMINRCKNKDMHNFHRYGGRGIKVCKRWHDFMNFYSDMGEPPAGMTLDRIDNDKGYYKNNCTWSTRKNQQRNRCTTRKLTFNGVTKPEQEWAEEIGLNSFTLRGRINRGWPVEKALTTPNMHARKSHA